MTIMLKVRDSIKLKADSMLKKELDRLEAEQQSEVSALPDDEDKAAQVALLDEKYIGLKAQAKAEIETYAQQAEIDAQEMEGQAYQEAKDDLETAKFDAQQAKKEAKQAKSDAEQAKKDLEDLGTKVEALESRKNWKGRLLLLSIVAFIGACIAIYFALQKGSGVVDISGLVPKTELNNYVKTIDLKDADGKSLYALATDIPSDKDLNDKIENEVVKSFIITDDDGNPIMDSEGHPVLRFAKKGEVDDMNARLKKIEDKGELVAKADIWNPDGTFTDKMKADVKAVLCDTKCEEKALTAPRKPGNNKPRKPHPVKPPVATPNGLTRADVEQIVTETVTKKFGLQTLEDRAKQDPPVTINTTNDGPEAHGVRRVGD